MPGETHSTKIDVAGIGERWKGCGTMVTAIIALLGFIFGSGFFLNEVWKSKVLTYTVLPTYDLGGQAFTGLIVENRGRVTLTDVEIILADLATQIQVMNMPGAHEPAKVVEGGVGEKSARIQVPRLSQGTSLAIYIVTANPVTLQEKKTFFVSSNEIVGVVSSPRGSLDTTMVILTVAWVIVVYLLSRLFRAPVAPQVTQEQVDGATVEKCPHCGAIIRRGRKGRGRGRSRRRRGGRGRGSRGQRGRGY